MYPTGLQDVTQYGYINEDIWKQDGHNCAIGSFGVIVATRVIRKSEELLMNYGEDWAYWDSYKLTIAKTVARMLAEVALVLGIACYQVECRELNRAVQAWQLGPRVTLNHKRAGSIVGQAIMAVADGSYSNCGVLHNMMPGTVALSEGFADWVVRVCKCAAFYEQVAFREGLRC
jgi:hypothetical protein